MLYPPVPRIQCPREPFESQRGGVEEAKNRGGATIVAAIQCCIAAHEIASLECVNRVSGASRCVSGVVEAVRLAIFRTMRPLPLDTCRAGQAHSRALRTTATRAVAAALLYCAVLLAACGGDSTGVDNTAGLPAPGRWYATMFDSELVPFDYGGSMRLDSAWHVVEADGSTRLFVASSNEMFVTSIDTIDGRFVRADAKGTIQLLYTSGSNEPYPPSPVTVTRDSITVEDGATHLIDVYVRRR